MKILITSDTFTPTINGVVTSVLNLHEQLTQLGHEVRILTLSPDASSWKADNVYYVKSYAFNIYPGIRGAYPNEHFFLDEIIEWYPDLIHTQCEFFTMHFAKKIARHLGIPIIHTYHTMYEHYIDYLLPSRKGKNRLVGRIVKDILKPVSAVIAPTQKAKSSLEEFGIPVPIEVIPTGINLDDFHHSLTDTEKQELKEQLHIPSDKTILVTVGRVGKEKNLDEIIEFLTPLCKTEPIFYVIVGDGPYKEELQQIISSSELKDSVLFTGMVPCKETWKYYQLGDIFVSSSISETQGLTYIEALASGTPLVCRKDSCLEGVLIEEYNGYTFDNQTQFVQAISNMIHQPQLRQQLSKQARSSSEKFSKENFGLAVEDLYQKISGENKTSVILNSIEDIDELSFND